MNELKLGDEVYVVYYEGSAKNIGGPKNPKKKKKKTIKFCHVRLFPYIEKKLRLSLRTANVVEFHMESIFGLRLRLRLRLRLSNILIKWQMMSGKKIVLN
ncbi:hypothetical protein GFC01_04105 [Desulfofundulus thermobenzoicus]|uniref:Uncharacterized protein n=1 Tax=Desulfofundulus thermobenzoicus TaxID=29376 RepID=A0A6N7IQK2_9FIRM|nr:hypothetical protein [Desulfofundulus thermobenzoicus]MQL51458.1 hypothetical protein [Desulfofundulus thermobenzoicus]